MKKQSRKKPLSFIDLANEYGGEDNISLVIIEYHQILYMVMQNDDWEKNKRPL